MVARVSEFGAAKYDWNNWEGVDDGVRRYSEAIGRHLLAAHEGPMAPDPESGLPHLAHAAWSALATLELALREEVVSEERRELEQLFREELSGLDPPVNRLQCKVCDYGFSDRCKVCGRPAVQDGFDRYGP